MAMKVRGEERSRERRVADARRRSAKATRTSSIAGPSTSRAGSPSWGASVMPGRFAHFYFFFTCSSEA